MMWVGKVDGGRRVVRVGTYETGLHPETVFFN